VPTSRQFILEALREANIINLDGDKGDSCLMHLGVLHDMETCPIAEELLQGLINEGQMEICSANKEEWKACMQSGDKNPSKPKPLVIHFTKDITTQMPRGFQPSIAKTPTPFPYKSDKAVPWKYGVQGPDGRKGTSIIRVRNGIPAAMIINIFGTSSMTCSGCIFAPPKLPARLKEKGKAKADIDEREKTGLTVNDKAPIGKIAKEGDDFSKREYQLRRRLSF